MIKQKQIELLEKDMIIKDEKHKNELKDEIIKSKEKDIKLKDNEVNLMKIELLEYKLNNK